ncbi:phosphoethanolamine--lipid A transferase [Chitiniphilus purpureus]|uniref:Phosphoethanolamine--lipid A transferase n=1 Tax=Chitiniphilus purpureus TaxID=2981137 RepID=A0ABY6DZF3_9NEIS|nr:phosphoethanolamine--lipid A transferase [Chitiniphilus sp. CD1]UXY17218.1 phosphoethanolamine--lipid A transferase [Chitiniphilus sp. CD1]
MRNNLLRRSSSPALRAEWITLAVAGFLLVCCNVPFWSRLVAVRPLTAATWPGFVAGFAMLLAGFNLLLTLLAWPYVLRPILSLLLLATSLIAYFMNQYGVMIDVDMVRNAVETDRGELRDLLTFKMLLYVAGLGVLPIWLLWRMPIQWRPLARELLAKLLIIAGCVAVVLTLALGSYQTFASVARNHRDLRLLLTPTNYLQAVSRYLKRRSQTPATFMPIGIDARLAPAWSQRRRKAVTVIVIGETARADHFGLNGYARDTTPRLARQAGLINFTNMWSCGTETAVSLPCMFSNLGRDGFSQEQAQAQGNLLDVLRQAGLAVRWRDNQSGCKGVCARVPSEEVRDSRIAGVCPQSGDCFDAVLLAGLDQRIDTLDRSTVIVLHMMGSHGPAYFSRAPQAFKLFQPECRSVQLDRCSRQQIVNGYDNSLRYTDHVLSSLIDLLRSKAGQVDTAMIYLSDHGESLGEGNLYLHGTPYVFAPDAQKHVPALMWFSDGFERSFGIDHACLVARRHAAYSQDNLFHSVLGLLQVQVKEYRSALDVFAPCRRVA